jgi:hypothetical protein
MWTHSSGIALGGNSEKRFAHLNLPRFGGHQNGAIMRRSVPWRKRAVDGETCEAECHPPLMSWRFEGASGERRVNRCGVPGSTGHEPRAHSVCVLCSIAWRQRIHRAARGRAHVPTASSDCSSSW